MEVGATLKHFLLCLPKFPKKTTHGFPQHYPVQYHTFIFQWVGECGITSLSFQLPILHFLESPPKINYALSLLVYTPIIITLQLLKIPLSSKADYINSQYKMKMQSHLFKKKKKSALKVLKCKPFSLFLLSPVKVFFICNLCCRMQTLVGSREPHPATLCLAHSHQLLNSSSYQPPIFYTPAGVERSISLSHELAAPTHSRWTIPTELQPLHQDPLGAWIWGWLEVHSHQVTHQIHSGIASPRQGWTQPYAALKCYRARAPNIRSPQTHAQSPTRGGRQQQWLDGCREGKARQDLGHQGAGGGRCHWGALVGRKRPGGALMDLRG